MFYIKKNYYTKLPKEDTKFHEEITKIHEGLLENVSFVGLRVLRGSILRLSLFGVRIRLGSLPLLPK